jgi:flavin-dependent dehydrogenase
MEYLIIGAGLAGLQLGYLLAKAGRDLRSWKAGFAGKIQPIKLSSPIA